MSIRTFRRFISEACRSMVKNGLMTMASLFIVTACLFIFGVFISVTMNMNYLGDQLTGQCQIQAWVSKEAEYGGKIQGISNQIKKMPEVESVEFEEGHVTYENFIKTLEKGEDVYFKGVPPEAIRDTFKIKLKDISQTEAFAEKLSKIEGIEQVENKQDIANTVKNITDIVRHASVWIIIVFAFISLFIISNTIKLTVHSRGKEINIMKYVGATDAYIRWPFIIEGILTGIVAAIITFILTALTYNGVVSLLNGQSAFETSIQLKRFSEIQTTIIVSYILTGSLIGAFGSAISVRRYLKV